MTIATVIGFIAGTLTTISFVPQVLKTFRTKRCDDLSFGMLSAFASAVAFGRTTGFVIAAVLVVSFFIKAAAEERFLSRELGAEAYAAYRARVPMLVPLGPK